MSQWPLQRDCNAFYGDPSSPRFETANLTIITPPYKIYFVGKPARVRIHKKTADAWMAWFEAVWKNAGKDQHLIDKWGMSTYSGGYNYRHMTGNAGLLSMHAYGCATDWDAPNNGFRDRTPRLAQFYDQVVKPFIDLGGVWGGDWNGNKNTLDERSCDGMHFQFAKLS